MKPCMTDPMAQDDSAHVRAIRCKTCNVARCLLRIQSSALDVQISGNHYKDMVIQPAEFITRNGIGFLEGCVIKRMCRWRKKDGLKDLRKAIHEIELLIEMEESPVMSNALANKITDARQIDLDAQNLAARGWTKVPNE